MQEHRYAFHNTYALQYKSTLAEDSWKMPILQINAHLDAPIWQKTGKREFSKLLLLTNTP